MVKRRNQTNRKKRSRKGFCEKRPKPRKINASTIYETCTEQLSPFGGLLPLIKFIDLVGFREIFHFAYRPPSRDPKLGHYLMMVGILMLLFIGFNRIWHFVYVRLDAMLCGFFKLNRLPAATTFWRYVDSLGINQANSLLKVSAILRERVWQLCGLRYARIRVNIDTTVKTVYGQVQGARKGHNPKHRGKPEETANFQDLLISHSGESRSTVKGSRNWVLLTVQTMISSPRPCLPPSPTPIGTMPVSPP